MIRSPDLVTTKLLEADHFLRRMGEARYDLFAFYCDFSAFLSTTRSVTFTLQAVMSKHPEWPDWYEDAKRRYLGGRRAKFMVEMRNVTQKVGDHGITGGMSRVGGPVLHFFEPGLAAKWLTEPEQSDDVLTICRRHMGDIVALVAGWVEEFHGLWGLTLAEVDAHNVEDVEMKLGFPAGWTADLLYDEEGRTIALLGSPGETAPVLSDLLNEYPRAPEV